MKRTILTGTSGWMYRHWKGTFYPAGLKENQLIFYAREFKTVELNYSFYRIPAKTAYTAWYKNTPPDFSFAIKLNRYFTHLKRLISDDEMTERLERFMNDTQELKEKLAVILVQLHPRHESNVERLEEFFSSYDEIVASLEYKPSVCIEFRNISWFNDEIYSVLRKHSVALVFPSTPEFRRLIFPSGFAYIRIHGNVSYSEDQLKELKAEIDQYPPDVRKIFVYFNNDWNTYAIYNARYFISLYEQSGNYVKY